MDVPPLVNLLYVKHLIPKDLSNVEFINSQLDDFEKQFVEFYNAKIFKKKTTTRIQISSIGKLVRVLLTTIDITKKEEDFVFFFNYRHEGERKFFVNAVSKGMQTLFQKLNKCEIINLL